MDETQEAPTAMEKGAESTQPKEVAGQPSSETMSAEEAQGKQEEISDEGDEEEKGGKEEEQKDMYGQDLEEDGDEEKEEQDDDEEEEETDDDEEEEEKDDDEEEEEEEAPPVVAKVVEPTGSISAKVQETTKTMSNLWSSFTSVGWGKKKPAEAVSQTKEVQAQGGDATATGANGGKEIGTDPIGSKSPSRGSLLLHYASSDADAATEGDDLSVTEGETESTEANARGTDSTEGDEATQNHDNRQTEGGGATGYFGSYLRQVGAAAYTASKSTAVSMVTTAKQTGLLNHIKPHNASKKPKEAKPAAPAKATKTYSAKSSSGSVFSLGYFRKTDPHAWDDKLFNATKLLTGKSQTAATGAGLMLAAMEEQWRAIDKAALGNQEKHMEAFHAMHNVVVNWQRKGVQYRETEKRLQSLPDIQEELVTIKVDTDAMLDAVIGLNAVLAQAERNAHDHLMIVNKQKADQMYREREEKHTERMDKWDQQKAMWKAEAEKQRKDWRPEEEVEAVKALETELRKGGSGDLKVTEVTLGLTDKDNKLVDSTELENFYNDESPVLEGKSAREKFELRKEERRKKMIRNDLLSVDTPVNSSMKEDVAP